MAIDVAFPASVRRSSAMLAGAMLLAILAALVEVPHAAPTPAPASVQAATLA
jgi:hypothetical protein